MRSIPVLLAAIAFSSVVPALAAPAPSSASLAAPTRAPLPITDAGVWHCSGTSCTGIASPMLREAVATCTGIADAAGRVAAFTAAGYSFTEADLARCNRHVKS